MNIIENNGRRMPTVKEVYVYSACCTWHGYITETAFSGIPVCPHCGSPLMQYDSREQWDQGISDFCRKQEWDDVRSALYARWMQSLHDSKTCVPLKDWDWRAAIERFRIAEGVN